MFPEFNLNSASKILFGWFLVLLTFVFVEKVIGQEKSEEQKIEILIEVLKTCKGEVEFDKTGRAFDEIDKDAVPFLTERLIKLLRTELLETNMNANFSCLVKAFGKIGKDAVPALIDILKTTEEDRIRRYAINALAEISEKRREAIPVLDEAVPLLTEILKTRKDNVPNLIEIAESVKPEEIPALREFVETTVDSKTRDAVKEKLNAVDYLETFDAAAHCLGKMGMQARDAVPVLIEVLATEKNRKNHFNKRDCINWILADLMRNSEFSANEEIAATFRKNRNEINEEDRKYIEGSIYILEKGKEPGFGAFLRETFTKFPYIITIAFLIIFIFLIWLTILFSYPIGLVNFHEKFLPSGEVTFLRILKIPLQNITPFFILRPRALDAWVKKNRSEAGKNFFEIEIVKERSFHIPVKVSLNGKENTDFDVETLQEVFNDGQPRLMIYGDGGAGKTSLACQIAKWAMQRNGLFVTHSALPVLIEDNFIDDTIQEAIIRKLKLEVIKTEGKISSALLKELLKKKRILVIVDGMSELEEATRKKILEDAEINAIVYTSRNDEIKSISKIETSNIAHGNLFSFLEKYIEEKLKEKKLKDKKSRKLFNKSDIHKRGGELTELAGDKGISVLLAKLYVELMIAQKEGIFDEDLPKNIPELMRKTVKTLYDKTLLENLKFTEFIKVVKMIAWECLKKDYRPIPADRGKIIEALKDVDKGREAFEHLEEKLKVIETKGIDDDKVSFKIDPLAEYLAAMHLVEENSYDDRKWERFIEDALSKEGSPTNIKGFLLAVRDCCLIEEKKDKMSPFIIKKLNELIMANEK